MNLQDVTTKTEAELQNLSAEDRASLKRELKENWGYLHDKLIAYNLKDFEKLSESDLRRLYPDVTLARRLKKKEFVEFMGTGEIPPIKLTPQEMEIVSGGLSLGIVLSTIALGLSSALFGGVVCVAACVVDAMDKEKGLVR